MPAPTGPRQRSTTGRNRNSVRNIGSKGGNLKTALDRDRTTGLGGLLNKPTAAARQHPPDISFTPKDVSGSQQKLTALRTQQRLGTALRTSQLQLPEQFQAGQGLEALGAAQSNLTALALIASRRGGGQSPGGGGRGVPQVAAKGPLQQYARRLARKMYGKGEFPELNQLIMHESGWNPEAQNPGSTAYGIGQFLDSTWAGVGMKKTSDPYKQIRAMLKYIQQRYQTPTNAWEGYYGGNLNGPSGY